MEFKISSLFSCCLLGSFINSVQADVQESFDYIIVGGGASGLVIGDRLTEDPSVTVLVLEYGIFDDREDFLEVPGLLGTGPRPRDIAPRLNRYIETVETEPVSALNGRTFPVVAPAVVGGGTSMNGMVYDRESRDDLGAWVKLGNEGWGWDDLLPYYKKSETFTPVSDTLAEQFNVSWDESTHGSHGGIQSSIPSFIWPEAANIVRAWNSLGIPIARDCSEDVATGVTWPTSTVNPPDERRSSARTAYYDSPNVSPARQNYTIRTHVAVNKIVFEGNVATGVNYIVRDTGEVRFVNATREVIVAAGPLRTPQLLQLSGIGPSDLLGEFGIKTIVDLPVGYNLQDHPEYIHEHKWSSRITPNTETLLTNETYQTEQMELYHSEHEGPYTLSSFSYNVLTRLSLSQITPNRQSIIDSIQHQDAAMAYPTGTTISDAVSEGYNLQRTTISGLLASDSTPAAAFGGLQFFGESVIWLYHPLSRGTVFINSTDVFEHPLINSNAMALESDVSVLAASLRKSRQAFAAPGLRDMGPTETQPGVDVTSDEQLISSIREIGSPGSKHVCCTAPMMPRGSGGVVDDHLLVYGVRNLRIVDRSVVPIVGTASGMSTTYAVAEKAADLIKQSS